MFEYVNFLVKDHEVQTTLELYDKERWECFQISDYFDDERRIWFKRLVKEERLSDSFQDALSKVTSVVRGILITKPNRYPETAELLISLLTTHHTFQKPIEGVKKPIEITVDKPLQGIPNAGPAVILGRYVDNREVVDKAMQAYIDTFNGCGIVNTQVNALRKAFDVLYNVKR